MRDHIFIIIIIIINGYPIEQIEKIQKRATKLVITLRKIPYKDRLMSLKLHTLKYRRLRGEMIEVVKIVNDIYDEKVAPTLHFNKTSVTRGNNFKSHNQTFTHNLRKHFFRSMYCEYLE